jgi:hypothetical protein
MAHSASLLNSKSEFDSFLFAPIGEDRKGTVISVLTAFARMDFDPWKQAADFARLPKDVARTKLAALIATLPGMSPDRSEPGTVAARLIALLPGAAQPTVIARDAWLGAGQPINLRSPRFIISIAVFMALSLASQFFMASLQPAQPASGASAQSAGATPLPASVAGQGAATFGPTAGKLVPDSGALHGGIDLQNGKQPDRAAGSAIKPAPPIAPARKPLFGK